MLRVLLSSLALALAVPALAQDPLKSGPCEQRLAALHAARRAGAEANAERLEVLRRQATQACLGGTGAATRPAPVLREPLAVAPPTPEVPRPPRSPVPAAPRPRRWPSSGRRSSRPATPAAAGTATAPG